MKSYQLITILGPTASGKTTLAAALADKLGSEIISADSRQVYRGMDIGTGKDLVDYTVNERQIPYHLINICDAGYKYNVYEFQHDFHRVFSEISKRNKLPVLCGGTGLYLESVLKGYKLPMVPENPDLRQRLENKSLDELKDLLNTYVIPHNKSDLDSCKRAIRAIEIAEYSRKSEPEFQEFEPINSLIVGINPDREMRRDKITKRLKNRLDEGMIDEVRKLMDQGVSPDDLIYYGLEYKYVTKYLIGELTYQEFFQQLEVAIHQFAKRQMTWFRGMEKRGFTIQWIPPEKPLNEKIDFIISQIATQ